MTFWEACRNCGGGDIVKWKLVLVFGTGSVNAGVGVGSGLCDLSWRMGKHNRGLTGLLSVVRRTDHGLFVVPDAALSLLPPARPVTYCSDFLRLDRLPVLLVRRALIRR